jgi:2'-5' RNA ligase
LFFALWPDDPVRHALLRWQTANLGADVRWQHRADLHLTLHFLGSVDDDLLASLQRLGEDCVGPGFDLSLDRIGYWARPQVLQAAPSRVPEALLALHGCLADGLRRLDLPVDERAYRPHVTLARKVRAGQTFGPLGPLAWSVQRLALVESRPGDAPHYRPLRQWELPR